MTYNKYLWTSSSGPSPASPPLPTHQAASGEGARLSVVSEAFVPPLPRSLLSGPDSVGHMARNPVRLNCAQPHQCSLDVRMQVMARVPLTKKLKPTQPNDRQQHL